MKKICIFFLMISSFNLSAQLTQSNFQSGNNVLNYDNELIQGDNGLAISENKRSILVQKDNTIVTLNATIYNSNTDGVNYYIHHHRDGIQEKSFIQLFTGLHGGKSTNERVITRTVFANSGNRIFVASDTPMN